MPDSVGRHSDANGSRGWPWPCDLQYLYLFLVTLRDAPPEGKDGKLQDFQHIPNAPPPPPTPQKKHGTTQETSQGSRQVHSLAPAMILVTGMQWPRLS